MTFKRQWLMPISLALCLLWPQSAQAQIGEFDIYEFCLDPVPREDALQAYEIIEEVFKSKLARNHAEGLIDEAFFKKIKDLQILLCKERGSYSTFGYEEGIIVIDHMMIGFMFLQARAMIIGGYLAREKGQEKSFAPYDELLQAFFSQDDRLDGRAFEIPIERALREGMDRNQLSAIMKSEDFATREQTLFLVMLYFLAAHEACHFALEHHGDPKRKTSEAVRFTHEYEADACALELVNKDEARAKRSPIAIFGSIAVLGTQAMLNKVNAESEVRMRTHPTSLERFNRAHRTALAFIDAVQKDSDRRAVHRATTVALGTYFREQIAR